MGIKKHAAAKQTFSQQNTSNCSLYLLDYCIYIERDPSRKEDRLFSPIYCTKDAHFKISIHAYLKRMNFTFFVRIKKHKHLFL